MSAFATFPGFCVVNAEGEPYVGAHSCLDGAVVMTVAMSFEDAKRAFLPWTRETCATAANEFMASAIMRVASFCLALPLYGRIFGWW